MCWCVCVRMCVGMDVWVCAYSCPVTRNSNRKSEKRTNFQVKNSIFLLVLVLFLFSKKLFWLTGWLDWKTCLKVG